MHGAKVLLFGGLLSWLVGGHHLVVSSRDLVFVCTPGHKLSGVCPYKVIRALTPPIRPGPTLVPSSNPGYSTEGPGPNAVTLGVRASA